MYICIYLLYIIIYVLYIEFYILYIILFYFLYIMNYINSFFIPKSKNYKNEHLDYYTTNLLVIMKVKPQCK